MEDEIFFELFSGDMANESYTVLVRIFLFGQYRIQLTCLDQPDPYAPIGHGSIVRELDSYDQTQAILTCLRLRESEDPEAYCESLAKPFNCEYPGGRIRLDNTPDSRPETGTDQEDM